MKKMGYGIPMKASVVISALDKQVGGNHYKQFPIQPIGIYQ